MHDNSGAGRAALRLHQALCKRGCDSSVLVSDRFSGVPSVLEPSGLTRFYKKLQPILVNSYIQKKLTSNSSAFSANLTPSLLCRQINEQKPDIVHLHWIGWDFFKIEEMRKLKGNIVWTLHDMWPFTGGCHYDEGCGRYREKCGDCPLLKNKSANDLSHKIWKRKRNAWKGMEINVVTPSCWMATSAKESSLFKEKRIDVIANGLDPETYKPADKIEARKRLNLPTDKNLVLFGAANALGNPRKGFNVLKGAIEKLSRSMPDAELVIFGATCPASSSSFALKTHHMGNLADDVSLALLYSAADLFVAPSLQDNLPNTVMEALFCGIPVVAFNIGGMPDMIEHQKNGCLAKPFDENDLAGGIRWCLNEKRKTSLGESAREKAVEQFSIETQATRYLDLYNEIIKN